MTDGRSSAWCVELSRAGNLEAWYAPLSNGRHAVAFINRSPAPHQQLTLDLPSTLGHQAGATADVFTVKEVWSGRELEGTVSTTLRGVVAEPHGSNFYILTPVDAVR